MGPMKWLYLLMASLMCWGWMQSPLLYDRLAPDPWEKCNKNHPCQVCPRIIIWQERNSEYFSKKCLRNMGAYKIILLSDCITYLKFPFFALWFWCYRWTLCIGWNPSSIGSTWGRTWQEWGSRRGGGTRWGVVRGRRGGCCISWCDDWWLTFWQNRYRWHSFS